MIGHCRTQLPRSGLFQGCGPHPAEGHRRDSPAGTGVRLARLHTAPMMALASRRPQHEAGHPRVTTKYGSPAKTSLNPGYSEPWKVTFNGATANGAFDVDIFVDDNISFDPSHVWTRWGEKNKYTGIAWIESPSFKEPAHTSSNTAPRVRMAVVRRRRARWSFSPPPREIHSSEIGRASCRERV